MEQLINGRFEYEVPQLLLSAERIEESTKPGENIRGELVLAAEDGSRIKGIAYSSHRRLLLGKERFSGEKVTIPYGADVKGLNPGDSFSGEIVFTTSIGEYRLPFQISVQKYQVKTSTGSIHDLDAFTKLAKEDFREAYHLFLDESFPELLKNDQDLLPYYYAMSCNPVTWQHLEEFLIGIGRKERVELELEKDYLEIYEVQNSMKDVLRIHRSTWGYLKASVTVEGDFLEVEKKQIRDEDFIGSVYDMEYIIRKENLGKGRNFGRIRIRTVYGEKIYEVMASKAGKIQVNVNAYEKKKKLELMRALLDFRMKKISMESWVKKSDAILTELRETGHFTTEYQLFQVYLYDLTGEKERAEEELENLKENSRIQKEEELEGLYLYLCNRMEQKEEQKHKILLRMHQLYQRKEDSFLLLYILLQIDKEASRTPSRIIYLLEEQYRLGCRSPFLYLEACRIAAEDGTMLRRFGSFSLQVLRFAKKYDILNEEMAFRATDLSGQLKNFSQPVYELLAYIYDKYPSTETVRAICVLIMKGNPRKSEYFRWYELAVQKELKITRLYEYYIETMSRNYQKVLPRMIRMYFSYNNTLSDTKKAFVYSNVIRNKELDKATYQSYRSSMEQFACEKLKEGRMNEDFAVVYQEFCMDSREDSVRRALARVLFTHRLYCDDPKIRKVIVRHAALKEEQVYTCNDKVAYISVYTPDARIVFEDDHQRRYIQTVDYNLQPLIERKELAERSVREGYVTPGLLLYICGELKNENPITRSNIYCFQDAAQEEAFSEAYRQRIRRRLLLFYQENMDNENLRDSLQQMDFHSFAKVNKGLLITILIKQKMYVGAYDLLCEYGYEGISVCDLLKLCSRMILNLEFEYEEEVLLLAYYIFQEGTYDEVILTYLAKYFEGPVDAMIEVWKRAMGFSIEAYGLEEDILTYSMFGRSYTAEGAAVLQEYIRQKGQEKVILAYLTFEAFGYFIGQKETDAFIFQSIEKIRKANWEHDIICDLALLKFYEEQNVWKEEQMETARQILGCCEKAGLKFAFYQKMPKTLLQSIQKEDKVFVECRAGNCAKVTLCYRITSMNRESSEYKSELLNHLYYGIFNKEFILFYGEVLQYYFIIEEKGEERRTKEKTLIVPSNCQPGETKYQMINCMLAARQQGREEELKKAIERYEQLDIWTSSLFQLME